MYLRAWIDGLHRINNHQPAVRPLERPPAYVRLDDPTRPPTVPLRPLKRRSA
jgi:hypothetical protein